MTAIYFYDGNSKPTTNLQVQQADDISPLLKQFAYIDVFCDNLSKYGLFSLTDGEIKSYVVKC